jgi:hypothetical protein
MPLEPSARTCQRARVSPGRRRPSQLRRVARVANLDTAAGKQLEGGQLDLPEARPQRRPLVRNGLWAGSVLHIAPEPSVRRLLPPGNYIAGDLNPSEDKERVDLTDMTFAVGSFDAVIANHVMEHIPGRPGGDLRDSPGPSRRRLGPPDDADLGRGDRRGPQRHRPHRAAATVRTVVVAVAVRSTSP